MKKSLLILIAIVSFTFAMPVFAEPPFRFKKSAEIYVSEAFAQKAKGEDFITGNKIVGEIRVSGDGFTMIALSSIGPMKKESNVVVIPTAEILYIKGQEKLVNF